jgi:hypothetical protein
MGGLMFIEVNKTMDESGSSSKATAEPSGDDPDPCRGGSAEPRGTSLTARGDMV